MAARLARRLGTATRGATVRLALGSVAATPIRAARDRGGPRGPAADTRRPPTSPPRRSPASCIRSTTSARPPSTAASSPPASCTGSSARPAAGERPGRGREPIGARRRSTCSTSSRRASSRRRWRRSSRARRGSSDGSRWPARSAPSSEFYDGGPADRPRDARGRAGRAHRCPSAARGAARQLSGAVVPSSRATTHAAEATPPIWPRPVSTDLNARLRGRGSASATASSSPAARARSCCPDFEAALGGRPRRRDPAGHRRRHRHRARPACQTDRGHEGGRHGDRTRANRYGKAAIRLVRVGRDTTPHRLRDLTVAVALEGDFAAAHTDGDNANVIATDTMKNTAYAFAPSTSAGSIEAYATALARHFLERAAGRPRDRQRPRARLAPHRGRRRARAGRVRPDRRGDPRRDGRRDPRRDASSRPASRTSS